MIFKRVFILVSLLCGIAFSQSEFEIPLLSDITIVPNDSVYSVYYSYRIPTNSFVFVKDGKGYSANYGITVEVRDSSSEYFSRQISENKITAAAFDETVDRSSSQEGLLKFVLKKGTYIFTPILSDFNSNHEYKARSIKAVCGKSKNDVFLSPIVVDRADNGLNKNFTLTNYAGNIPFSEEEYELIIPSIDTSLKSISAELINDKDTVFKGELNNSFVSRISVSTEQGIISIENNSANNRTRNFLITGFSRKLTEGSLKIILKAGNDSSAWKTFTKKVIWFNKPFSLRDPERAIRLLSVINSNGIVDSLLSGSSKNYEHNLFKYWKRFDPTKNSAFNPLMAEYYNRVDYAFRHFYTISRKREFLTDMSKVYIKYGKPVEIKRSYNQYGKSIETWVYKNPANIFDFIDPDGTGNFMLVNKNG